MTKHLVDIDEAALASARAALGTATMKDTVNEALRRVGSDGEQRRADAVARLGELMAALPPFDREAMWGLGSR